MIWFRASSAPLKRRHVSRKGHLREKRAEPRNPHFEQAVRDSFAEQQLMATLGARLTAVAAGKIEIRVAFRSDLTQQHGFLHAGVVTSALDSACGYAALSLMPAGVGVLSVEFKINLLAPARGEELIARGRVVRAGRTITVCQAEATMVADGAETSVATMLATIMTIRDRTDVVGCYAPRDTSQLPWRIH